MWRPEKRRLWFFPTPSASQRANSCFMLCKSRPNDLFYFFFLCPTLGCQGFLPFFPKPIYFKGYYRVHTFFKNITRVSRLELDGLLVCCSSGSRPFFTGGASLWSLQSATVTRLQMSVGKKGKKARVNALLMTLSRVTRASFIKKENKAQNHYAESMRNLGAVLGFNKENSAKWGVMGYISVLYALRCTWQLDVVVLFLL